jgi:hypothetical protein
MLPSLCQAMQHHQHGADALHKMPQTYILVGSVLIVSGSPPFFQSDKFLGGDLSSHGAYLGAPFGGMATRLQEGIVVLRIVHVEAASVYGGLYVPAQSSVAGQRGPELGLDLFLESLRNPLGGLHRLPVPVGVFHTLASNSQAKGHQSAQKCAAGLSPFGYATGQHGCRLERLQVSHIEFLLQTQEDGLGSTAVEIVLQCLLFDAGQALFVHMRISPPTK